MIGHKRCRARKPKIRHGRENPSLIRNGSRQNDIKSREPIGGHNKKMLVIYCIDIADLALAEALHTTQIRSKDYAHHDLSLTVRSITLKRSRATAYGVLPSHCRT